MITASKETKVLTVTAQGTGGLQFDCPTTVNYNNDVNKVLLIQVHRFCLMKYRSTLITGIFIPLTPVGVNLVLNTVLLKHV